MSEKFQIRFLSADLLRTESARILAMLAKAVPNAEILEVGSTAIVGAIGKQDIDFVIRATHFKETREQLDRFLERNANQFSANDFQGYHIESPLDASVQLVAIGGEHDSFHIFKDTLNAEPGLVAMYNALKRKWNGKEMQAYREAKASFIGSVIKNSKLRR